MAFEGMRKNKKEKKTNRNPPFSPKQEEFDRVFTINTRAQFFVAREAYRHLNHSGRIILMSSNTAKDFTVPAHSLYSGSKAAVESFVRVFAKDCGRRKITVNAVAPGGTVTDMFHDVSQHYIPSGENYTAEERQQVSGGFFFWLGLRGVGFGGEWLTVEYGMRRWPRMLRR